MTGNRTLITTAAIACLSAGTALGALLLWPADKDALPPQLLVQAARSAGDADAPAPAPMPSVTAMPPVVVAPVAAVPVQPPSPPSPAAEAAPASTPPAPLTAPAGRPAFLVVVGSYAQRDQAEDRRRALGWSNLDVTEATVQGRPHYRVAIRSSTREQAVRALNAARAAGIRDAWIAPVSGDSSTAPDTAIAERAG